MRHIATLILTLLFCITAQAQNRTDALGCPIGSSRTSQATATSPNRIDKLVENLSTGGNTTFTSIVTRNKKTRAVEKVIKHAEITGNARQFIAAFVEECKKNDYLEKSEGSTKTINITIDGKKEKRTYILQYNWRSKNNAIITIIINYK
jgi:hypothetical protein